MKNYLAFGVLLAVPVAVVNQSAAVPESAGSACVKLLRSEPFHPDEAPMPRYPDDAKANKVEGNVSFHFEVGSGCATEEIAVDDGPQMLPEAIANAVKEWKYCGVPEGQEIHATVAFRLNCPVK